MSVLDDDSNNLKVNWTLIISNLIPIALQVPATLHGPITYGITGD